tara:strand:- start:95297 stop:95602 length:306 start_codon:yes stop_codon:yes gene_type:complete
MSSRVTVAATPASSKSQATGRISVKPNPAPAGSEITICYDFSGAVSPVTLSLSWDPSQEPSSIQLSSSDNCKKVTANDNAEGLLITDESGQSWDEGVTFTS